MKNMWTKYRDITIGIIDKIIDMPNAEEKIDTDTELKNIGMDSLSFVRIVVEIENQFGIEFPEDRLDIAQAGTVRKLCETIVEVKGEK